MALWKPFLGNRTALDAVEKRAGYVYWCADDGSLHFDYIDADNVLQRKQINAKDAETLMGASLTTLLNSSDVEIPTSKAVKTYVDDAVANAGGFKTITFDTSGDTKPEKLPIPAEDFLAPYKIILVLDGILPLIYKTNGQDETGAYFVHSANYNIDGTQYYTECKVYQDGSYVITEGNPSSSDGGIIIDVTELPNAGSEGIVENALYRTSDGVLYQYYGAEWLKVTPSPTFLDANNITLVDFITAINDFNSGANVILVDGGFACSLVGIEIATYTAYFLNSQTNEIITVCADSNEIVINRISLEGADGVSATHSWNGTVLTITSASGTSSADLKGEKGDQGIQGEKGEKGDSPVRGTDYWTEADKAEIKAYVDDAILNGAW